MKGIAYRNLAPVIFVAVVAAGCGQKPSFEERETTQRSSDGRINDHGIPVGRGSSGDDAGDGADGIPPGDDPLHGDKEPENEAGDGGHGDGGLDGGSGDGGGGGSDGETPDPDGEDPDPSGKKLTREMSFPSHVTMPSEVSKNLDDAHLTQTIELQRLYHDRTRQTEQLTRPQANDQFDQGHDGAMNTEMFDQVANRLLDILVIIDNSNSMQQEQQNLASKLNPLLSYVQDSDWQIGVVTTDPNQASLRSLIKKGDPDYMQAFADAVTAGVLGSNNERGVLQAVRSLAGYNMPSKWIRDDSTLAILIVSDEDNCSDGNDCPGKAYASGDYLYDYLAQIRNPKKNARVYGIFWHPSQAQAQCPTALNKADIWSKLVADTDGTWGSICDDDYTETLETISKDILVSLNSRFTVRYQPEPGSVRVFLDSTEINTGFTVSDKVVEFNPPPAEGTKITISYRYGAAPINKTFQLSYRPVPDKLYVAVNGQVVPQSDYTVDQVTQTVEFSTAPVERSKISVVYTRDVPLLREFQVGDVIKQGSVLARIDGIETDEYVVQEATGTLTFNAPPPEGAQIVISYVAVGAPILNYPFMPSDGPPVDLVVYDAITMAPVRASYANGMVSIDEDDFVEGRALALQYDNVSRQRFEVILPNEPIPGTVKAVGGARVCTGSPYLQVVGSIVKVDNCGFADDIESVRVNFDYVVAAYQEFTFAVDNLPKPDDWQEWRVYVNDQTVTAYTRNGNVIRFDQPLAVGSVVKIQLIQEVK